MRLYPTPDCSLEQLARAALRMRAWLIGAGIPDPLLKTSGARGLHVMSFIEPAYDHTTVREVSRKVAVHLAHSYPGQFTVRRHPNERPPEASPFGARYSISNVVDRSFAPLVEGL